MKKGRGGVRLLLTLSFSALMVACAASPPRPFDSRSWKSGSSSSRGSMVEDIADRRLLIGKTKAEVEELLGAPDVRSGRTFDYEVVTISRCYFWECRMEVYFDEGSGLASGVAVSD